MSYDIIVGMEVHVQLLTRSKLFCACPNRFGDPPNTNVCPVCLGLPGVLPVMNRHAFELSLRAAAGLNCTLADYTKWDRKGYYYPDLPKNYQISQYDQPLSLDGALEFYSEGQRRRVGIIRAHLEEDAGKLMHTTTGASQVDLNRTGTPLLEIVSEPDITGARQAYDYLTNLKLLLQYLEVSDCNMQEGSLRAEPNVNLRIPTDDGDVFTPIAEVKNVNSFRAVEKAIAQMAELQYKQWQKTGVTKAHGTKTTYGWDDERETLVPQRQKEEAEEYRYFPEPDLAPVTVDEAWRTRTIEALPERPVEKYERFVTEHKLSEDHATKLVQDRALADYFETLARQSGDAQLAANYTMNEVSRKLNELGVGAGSFAVGPERLAGLLKLVKADTVSSKQGRKVFEAMIDSEASAGELVKELGLEQISDTSELERIVDDLIAEHPDWVEDHKKGKPSANAFMGQVMKATRGQANPKVVMGIIMKKLGS